MVTSKPKIMTSEQQKAIDACKDQAAKELSKGFWTRWDDFLHDARNRADWIKKFNEYSDRAMQLYGEQCANEASDSGYRDGYQDAYDGRPHKFAVQKDWGDELPY